MDISSLLVSFGPFALCAIALIVFVEIGLLFPFLPGDSLVFAAALLAAQLHVHWALITLIAALAALLGGEMGYYLGKRFGPRMFRPDARILNTQRLKDAGRFFERWGAMSIILGRFVPIIRTYLAPAAAVAKMRHSSFSLWNAISAVAWAGLFGIAGRLFGSIPWVAHNVEWIALGIVVVTVAPIIITALARRRRSTKSESAEPTESVTPAESVPRAESAETTESVPRAGSADPTESAEPKL